MIRITLITCIVIGLIVPITAGQVQEEYQISQASIVYVNSIGADSSRIILILEPFKVHRDKYLPAVLDIRYSLLEGDTIIFSETQHTVSLLEPTRFNQDWQVNLANNREYTARADIFMYVKDNMKLVRTSSTRFVADMDADISDVYGDANGASATIRASSMVPLDAKVTFSLFKEGMLLETRTAATPHMTSNSDDETVNILWDQSLQPGSYEIHVRLSDQDGKVIDSFDETFQSETVTEREVSSGPTPTQTPGFTSVWALVSVLLFSFLLKRVRR